MRLININIVMNIDYNNLEDVADNGMSIEVVTEDCCEGTNCQMPTESVNRTRSSDIDIELNTGKILKLCLIVRILNKMCILSIIHFVRYGKVAYKFHCT